MNQRTYDILLMQGDCVEMVVRLGAVTGVGHARLIIERFGKFWGSFSVGDLFLLNFLTIVTEFIGVSLALGYFGVSRYLSVPIAAAALVTMTATGGATAQRDRVPGAACATTRRVLASDWQNSCARPPTGSIKFTPRSQATLTHEGAFMSVLSWNEFALRLGAAVLGDAMIGFDRQWRSRGARERRHRRRRSRQGESRARHNRARDRTGRPRSVRFRQHERRLTR